MRTLAIAFFAGSALCSASAYAADLAPQSLKDAPAYVPVYSWTGFYIGAHVGGAFPATDDTRTDVFGLVNTDIDSAFIGGGQVGANYQWGSRWVIGVEADISARTGSGDRTFGDGTATLTEDPGDWIASVTGRLGWTWGDAMVYVKGGVAFRDQSDLDLSGAAVGIDIDRDDTGWTAGGGLEGKIAPCWSAKIEYQFYNFGKTDVSTTGFGSGTGVSFNDDVHTLKVGVNYFFY
jgi:outer membrane immunogenic protein